jgi:hypothetical protein
MKSMIRYPNFWSRVLLRQAARRQQIYASDFPAPVDRFLAWYERRVLRVDVSAVRIDRPIFVVGLPRSGTTMVQDILCTHTQVAYLTNAMQRNPARLCAIEVLRRRLRLDFETDRFVGDSVAVSAGSPSDSTVLWGQWFLDDPLSLAYRPRTLADFPPERIDEIHTTIRRILWSFGPGEKRFYSKLLGVFPHLAVMRELFPDARFVHMIRDPRMTANSMLKLYQVMTAQQAKGQWERPPGAKPNEFFIPYPRFPGLAESVRRHGLDDIRTTASLWNEAADFVQRVRHQFPAWLDVRYEDILAAPATEIARILEFCQLPAPGPENEGFQRKVGQIGVLRHTNQYGNFQTVEDICGANMRRYGYLTPD